jgi:hypothetical protein
VSSHCADRPPMSRFHLFSLIHDETKSLSQRGDAIWDVLVSRPHCACVPDLVAKLAEADERIKREMAENEKLRALLAEWVSGATFHDDPISRATRMAFFQEMARRTAAFLNAEAKP